MAKKPLGRGRPKGSGLFNTTLRFAVSSSVLSRLKKYQDRHKIPNVSEAARRVVERGLEAEGV